MKKLPTYDLSKYEKSTLFFNSFSFKYAQNPVFTIKATSIRLKGCYCNLVPDEIYYGPLHTQIKYVIEKGFKNPTDCLNGCVNIYPNSVPQVAQTEEGFIKVHTTDLLAGVARFPFRFTGYNYEQMVLELYVYLLCLFPWHPKREYLLTECIVAIWFSIKQTLGDGLANMFKSIYNKIYTNLLIKNDEELFELFNDSMFEFETYTCFIDDLKCQNIEPGRNITSYNFADLLYFQTRRIRCDDDRTHLYSSRKSFSVFLDEHCRLYTNLIADLMLNTNVIQPTPFENHFVIYIKTEPEKDRIDYWKKQLKSFTKKVITVDNVYSHVVENIARIDGLMLQ